MEEEEQIIDKEDVEVQEDSGQDVAEENPPVKKEEDKLSKIEVELEVESEGVDNPEDIPAGEEDFYGF